MSDERYIKLLTEINKYGLDKGCAVEVMAVHNATGQTVKQLCGMHEKEVLQQLIEGYLFQKEQRSKLEAENAALRERLEKAVDKTIVSEMLAKYFDCPCNFSPLDEEMWAYCRDNCVDDNIECWIRVINKKCAELKGEKE